MSRELKPERLLSHHPTAKTAIRRLRKEGFRTVIVGGAVRDMLREKLHPDFNLRPEKIDIDIATAAGVEEIEKILDDFKLLKIGAKFGVIMVVDPERKERKYEIAQFRREENYDGRRPEKVEPARSLKEDLTRRDFTINGMAMDREGELIDPVGGRGDLKNRKIKAIGDPDKRFREDHLRGLRAIRFACYIDGKIDPPTLQGIKENSKSIRDISWERIRGELFEIFETPRSASGTKIMDKTKLLDNILPELTDNKGVPQPEKYHPEGDVFEHSIEALYVADRLRYRPLIKLATLLHDVGKGRARRWSKGEHMGGHEEIGSRISKKIGERLRLSKKEIDHLTWIVSNHMRCAKLPVMNKAKKTRLIRHKRNTDRNFDRIGERYGHFSDLLKLLIADSQASAHRSGGWLPALEEFADLLPHLKKLNRRKNARELVNGDDLLEMGLEEGPLVGELLEKLYKKIFAGEITTRKEALKTAKKLLKKEQPEENDHS